MYISTNAIILKNTAFKESSIISRAFTYDHGKISFLFRGAKKNKNNISGMIEPGNSISITYLNGKANLKTVKEVSINDVFFNTRSNLSSYYYKMAIISIVDRLAQDSHPEKELYNVVMEVFNHIESNSAPVDIIFVYFLFHLTRSLGFELNTFPSNLGNAEKFNNFNLNFSELGLSKSDLSKIKILIYKHIRAYIIDLNDIHAVRSLRSYGLSSRPN